MISSNSAPSVLNGNRIVNKTAPALSSFPRLRMLIQLNLFDTSQCVHARNSSKAPYERLPR